MKFYEDPGAFKLFVCDLGLLGAMADVSAKDVLLGNGIFGEYKGAFTEQYAAQTMLPCGAAPCYFSAENSTLKLDFVLQEDDVYPIEVKAEENLRSKSLQTVLRNHPGMTGWRFSMSNYRKQESLVNVPLFLAEAWIRAHRA